MIREQLMRESVRAFYDAHSDPSPELVPISPQQLDRLDDNLHFGWAWHRYRYCFRRWDHLRILDAGCGTGLTTLGLAHLNPSSSVVGVDFSQNSLEIAVRRGQAAQSLNVEFREQDIAVRMPGALGPFDFIVCRDVLGQVDDPGQVLANLGRSLDHRGLLYFTVRTTDGRSALRRFRRAVEALCQPGTSENDQAQTAQGLFQSLRADHPLRRLESRFTGPAGPSTERIIAGYLGPDVRGWELEEVIALLKGAGLKFLYAAADQAWSADRVFGPHVPAELRDRVGALAEGEQTVLMDALDPSMYPSEYRVYACLSEFEPRVPGWPEAGQNQADLLESLIPHLSGLTAPASPNGLRGGAGDFVAYRAVSGMTGPIEAYADAVLRACDGMRCCRELDATVQAQRGVVETPEARQRRWLDLANHGFVLLESPDRRQHVDCVHLGPIRDRLDCACPRLWIRSCERHTLCTLDPVDDDDPHRAAVERARDRLGAERVQACGRCPDYAADETSAPQWT
jgi:SAM-dependent methyltransferase